MRHTLFLDKLLASHTVHHSEVDPTLRIRCVADLALDSLKMQTGVGQPNLVFGRRVFVAVQTSIANAITQGCGLYGVGLVAVGTQRR